MIRRPPRSTLPHTLFPSTTLFLSAVYRARANGDAAWADSRIASAIAARATIDLPDQQKWIEQVAAATGISAAILQQLVELADRSEEHTSELQSLMRISYAVFCLKKKKTKSKREHYDQTGQEI